MDNQTIVDFTEIVRMAIDASNRDADLYNISMKSKYYMRLLYHYTFKCIFDIKKSNINTIFTLDNIDDIIILPDNIKAKYIKFLKSLQRYIPSIIITNYTGTYQCPNLFNILTNLSEKSTKKNKNFYSLRKFCDRHGLVDILNVYIEDLNIRYILGA